jgi:CelD/BcsL family acetyltransferase involved in cellulose biosynthesis
MYIITKSNNFESIENWDKLLDKAHYSTVFMLSDWIKTWWKHYNDGKLCIISIYDKKKLIFFSATYIKIKKNIRVLKFISTHDSDYQNFFIDQNYDIKNICFEFLKYLKKNRFWDVVDFQNMQGDVKQTKIFIDLVKKMFLFNHISRQCKCVYIKDFSQKEKVINQIDSKLLSQVKKKSKKLKNKDIILETCSKNVNCCLCDFLKLREERWSNDKISKNNDLQRKYFNELTNKLLKKGVVTLCGYKKENNYVAISYIMKYSNKVYNYMHVFDKNYSKLSLGSILMYDSIEITMDKNYIEYDLLRGDEPYKYKWASGTRCNHRIVFANKNLLGILYTITFKTNQYLKKLKKVFSIKKS